MPRSPLVIRFKGRTLKHHWGIQAYGTTIGVSCNTRDAIDAARKRIGEVLPEFEVVNYTAGLRHQFVYIRNPSGRDSLYKNGETVIAARKRETTIDWLGSEVRLTVAENAVDRVFIHSAAVSWKGKAILLPADSLKGKTTLTAELVKRGALYYSDEYSVIDTQARLHPFPKKLSIRSKPGSRQQIDTPVEELGGRSGVEPAEVRMVILTHFKPNGRWSPRVIGRGQGVIEIIRNTLPIRRDPAFTMTVLRQLAENAVIIKTVRGEAAETADRILDMLDGV